MDKKIDTKNRNEVLADILSDPEKMQAAGTLLNEGIHGIFLMYDKMSHEVAANNAVKYEKQAEVLISALQEETKREMEKLACSRNYYQQFAETRDAYYKELESLRKSISEEQDLDIKKRYCDFYEAARDVLNSNMQKLASETNEIINKGRKKSLLTRIASFITSEDYGR